MSAMMPQWAQIAAALKRLVDGGFFKLTVKPAAVRKYTITKTLEDPRFPMFW
jgi:hypothetical protein